MKAHVHRGFTRSRGVGYHLVECSTFDPELHTIKTELPDGTWEGWYRSYKFYPKKATDEEVQADLDEFVTTLREYLYGQAETRPT